MAYLDVTMTDSDYHRQVDLPTGQELAIGRSPDCPIHIAHRSLSRQHCRLIPSGEGWSLEDCGSTNGTILNGHQLIGSRPIQEGDQIQAGVARIAFHIHDHSHAALSTTYQALDVPSAIARRADAVEHNMLHDETQTRIESDHDEVLLESDDALIDLWEDDDTPEADSANSLWRE